MKRTLALVLSLMLLLSLALSPGLAEEKITLKVLMNGNIQSFFDGEDENNNDIHTWLEEQTGYDLEYQVLPNEGGAEKRALIMASGDLPDLMVLGRTDYLDYVNQGYLLDLTAYIDGSEALQATDVVQSEVRAMCAVDGAEYAVGMPSNGSQAPDSLCGFIADMDAAGVTFGDMSPAAIMEGFAALKAAYPDKITYTGAGAGTGGYMLSDFGWLYCAYNLATPWRVTADGTLEYAATTEDMRACLAFIAEMNAKGYLDPEYAVLKNERLQEKIINEEAVTVGISWYDWPNPDTITADNGKTTRWNLYGNAVGEGGMSGQNMGPPVDRYLVVPVTCQHPEAVMDLIAVLCGDEAYDFFFYGEKGVDYAFDEAGNRYGLEMRRTAVTGTQYYVYYYVHENLEQRTGRLRYMYTNSDQKMLYDRAELYGLQLKDKLDPTYNMPSIESYIDNNSDMNDLCAKYFLKIASGALGIEAFDEFLAEFAAKGYDQVVADVNDWYVNQ